MVLYLANFKGKRRSSIFKPIEAETLLCCQYQKLLLLFFKVSTQESILKPFVEPWVIHPTEILCILLNSIYLFDVCYIHQCKIFLQHYCLQMNFRKKYITVIENLQFLYRSPLRVEIFFHLIFHRLPWLVRLTL